MIRRIVSRPHSIFLTFDDGPDEGTSGVLDVLRDKGAKATFFLVAEKLLAHEDVVRRMVAEGHAIGNHSWDHRYRNFFRGSASLVDWIEKSERGFKEMNLPQPVGFRPPAGVVTPPLKRILAERHEPLVLWNERFFDAVWEWTPAKAEKSAAKLEGGSVVLLHDRQPAGREEKFCRTLSLYIDHLRARGFQFEALTRSLCETKAFR